MKCVCVCVCVCATSAHLSLTLLTPSLTSHSTHTHTHTHIHTHIHTLTYVHAHNNTEMCVQQDPFVEGMPSNVYMSNSHKNTSSANNSLHSVCQASFSITDLAEACYLITCQTPWPLATCSYLNQATDYVCYEECYCTCMR